MLLGSVAWGDYDNDGDLDILLTGQDNDSTPIAKIYRNNECPELSIAKQVSPTADVEYYGTVTYTMVLSNAGGIATNVLLTDTLPAEVDFAGWLGDDHGAAVADDEIRWTGTVTGSMALTWTWQAVHTGGYGRVVTNTAWYGYGGEEEGDAAAFELKDPPVLILSKEATPATGVDYHGVVTYSATLTNLSGPDAVRTLLTDTLPAEVEFADWVEQNGAVCNGDVITWTGTVTSGMSATWMWMVTHTGGYGEVVTNTVRATYPGSMQMVEDGVTFAVKTAPALTLTKSVAPASGVDEGSVVTYTVMLQNTGESGAVGAAVTDTLPARVEFAQWVEQNGAVEASGVITWTGDIDPGAALTWTWQVTFTDGFNPVSNTAWYSHTVAGAGSATAMFSLASKYYFLPVILKQSH